MSTPSNEASDALYTTHLPGGQHWSLRLRRGTTMTLTAKDADTNAGMLLYNPENLLERLNLPDTLKGQHTFKLTRGHCLYSDMGRVFASIVEDDLGWHDSVGGNLMPQHMLAKGWQPVSYQQAHNEWTRTGYDSFLVELAKYGLGRRDMAANLNLFSRVESDDEGHLRYVPGHCQPGASVKLRFEMDTLVILHTCPHPLDPSREYPRRGVDIALGTAPAPTEDDVCYHSRPENARAFENNRLYHLGL
ncbi:urea carboxylase-associated family protein [Halomonas sp. McH1-25]|uniref:urea amidolyase associated protein UAAP1 n=2 Tax=Halomonas TaxID=2745 RepID=UPI001EF41633|nr:MULTISPECIES: urea amidolyase associated protein UAAP1 [unclassified Halomonas]MCG7599230.1 urea carboxylase-associated family protein [Halomonas sp. McH1-25]MCP1341098.1 urea carboxylase-associated family protein [Halomonas sp. FL8]